jgi:vesicular inhibitory amino acid transporter
VSIPEYNQTVNRLAVWLIAMNPIAKYGLTLNPVNISWQLWLLKDTELETWCEKGYWREPILTGIGKVLISVFIVVLAYIIPGFDKVMSLLGAFFSFMISGIFPIICHLTLFHGLSFKTKLLNYTLLCIASIMAFSGTLWSFI